MSLYRNYRPKDFPSLIGQDHIKITLLNAVKAGRIAHAYLFTGPRGTGKTTTARLMAKAINAEIMTEDGRFDGSELAEEIDQGRLIDVIEIDAASNRGIDEIRDLREKINYSPTRAKNKVYIIDEVHMLTKEAFNALLKTLEEPPSFVYFILATTEINKVPETIISRCQRFDFKRIVEADLLSRLKFVCEAEGFVAEEEALKIIARQSRGGLRDALSLLEQLVVEKKLSSENVKKILGMSNFASIEAVYKQLRASQAAEAMEEIGKLFMAGIDLVQFNKDFLDYLRVEMLEKVKADDMVGAKWVIEVIGNFQEAYEKQKYSYVPELPLEVAIVKSALKNKLGLLSDQESDGSKKKPEQLIKEVKVVTGAQRSVDLVEGGNRRVEVKSNEVKKDLGIEEKVVTSGIKTANSSGAELSLEQIKKGWQGALDRIDGALAKRCLAAGKPLEINGGELLLGFVSNFNKDKLFVAELLSICESALNEQFGCRITLKGKVDASLLNVSNEFSSLRNESHGSLSNRSEQSGSSEHTQSTTNVLSSALSAFGGQVIE